MSKIKTIVLGALFIAIGIALSLIFHSIGGTQLGNILLPLHFVTLLTGLVLGQWIGLGVGALTPLISALAFGMPPLSPPIAIFMVPELATYGFFAGYFEKHHLNIYLNLAITMLLGRLVYSLAYYAIGAMVGIHIKPVIAILISFAVGIPGVVLQFVLIPPILFAMKRKFQNE
jgi:predicted membrane protein